MRLSNAAHGIQGRIVSGKHQMVHNSIRSTCETETHPRRLSTESPCRSGEKQLIYVSALGVMDRMTVGLGGDKGVGLKCLCSCFVLPSLSQASERK
jgi:hypothetical protein